MSVPSTREDSTDLLITHVVEVLPQVSLISGDELLNEEIEEIRVALKYYLGTSRAFGSGQRP